VQGAVLFPGVGDGISENLITEAHGLLQNLNRAETTRLIISVGLSITYRDRNRKGLSVWQEKKSWKYQLTSFLLLQAVKRSV